MSPIMMHRVNNPSALFKNRSLFSLTVSESVLCSASGGGARLMLGTTSIGSCLISARLLSSSSSSLRSELVDTAGMASSTEVSLLGSFSYSFTAIC